MPLCERCHGVVHDCSFVNHGVLTKASLASKKARGEFTGGLPPYGYRRLAPDSRWTIPDEDEQAVIEKAKALRAAKLPLRQISQTLAEQGIKARNGRPFDAKQVARLLK